MSWWHNASTEQRLAFVQGGIECELSMRLIAGFAGLPPTKSRGAQVLTYARRHGFRTDNTRGWSNEDVLRGKARQQEKARIRRAYFHGEPLPGTDADEFRLEEVDQ